MCQETKPEPESADETEDDDSDEDAKLKALQPARVGKGTRDP